MPQTVTIIAPDGTPGDIPAANAQAAINAGGRMGVHVYAPDGTPGYVPVDQLAGALKAGGTINQANVPDANPGTPQGGIVNSGMRLLSGAGGALVDAGKGLYHAVQSAHDPGDLINSLVVQPQINQVKEGLANTNSPDMATRIAAGGHVLAGLIPGLGPLIGSTSDAMLPQIDKGNYAGALGTAVGNAGLGYLGNKVAGKLAGEPTVPGQNYTATNLKAHTGVLGRLTGLGDNFIPQQAASDTLTPIRQAAADNPTIAQTATAKGSSPQNIAALQAILQKANTALEVPHAQTIGQYANAPADVSSVQQAVTSQLPQTLAGVAPEDAAALSDLSGRLETINTMGGLNDLRTWLNNEAAASYKQDGVAANRSSAVKGAYRAAADAARGTYYDQLQQHSGIDFQPIKAQQAALLSQQEGLAGLGQKLSAQQAIADEPKSPQAVAAEAITGGNGIKTGPVEGVAKLIAAKVLRQTPLTQPNYLIRQALSNLPEVSPAAASTGSPLSTSPVTLASLPPAIQRILALTKGNQ